MGINVTNSTKDLVQWMKDPQERGFNIDPNDWDTADLDQDMLGINFERATLNHKYDIEPPKKFKPNRWIEKMENLGNYLHSLTSADGKRSMLHVI